MKPYELLSAAFAALWGADGWTDEHLAELREDGDVDLIASLGLAPPSLPIAPASRYRPTS